MDSDPVNGPDSPPVAVDAMGGDFGASVCVDGALRAAAELGVRTVLVGDSAELERLLAGRDAGGFVTVRHAPDIISMDESPGIAVRRKPGASVRVAFELVARGEASSVVSPGNTGAVMAAGLLVTGALPGIVRPAIASFIPKKGEGLPTILLDSGANIDCHAAQLVQFAVMGSLYAQAVLGRDRPRVALLSNGSESSKGTDVIRSAAQALASVSGLNYVGFVEGRDLPRDVADVVVCDGFVGNVVLKAMEGTVELVVDSMRQFVGRGLRGGLGMWLATPLLRSLFREKLDPSSYGGAPLLGLNAVAIVCHGSSNDRAIMNGVRVAAQFHRDRLVGRLERALADSDQRSPDVAEDGVWDRMSHRFDAKTKKDTGPRRASPEQPEPGPEGSDERAK